MVSKVMAATVFASSLMMLADDNKKDVSIHDVVSLVQSHADDPRFFKKIVYSLELKSAPNVNFEAWRALAHSFVDVALMAQHDTENKLKWLDMLGYPLKDIILLSGDAVGIHGDAGIQFGADCLSLKGFVECNDQSNLEAWKQIIGIWVDVVNRVANGQNEVEWSKGMGEMIVNALQASKDGVKTSIQWRLEDAEGSHYEIGYTS